MKVLITGSTGFLGSRLRLLLLDRGYDVTIIRNPNSSRANRGGPIPNVQEIHLDLSEPFDVNQIPEVDAVVTLAQERDFQDFPQAANRTLSVNVGSNVRIWEWAARNEVGTILHASSGGIYGSGTDLAFTEDTLPPPHAQNSFYLGTKLCAEVALQSFFPLFKSVVIVRPFFLYGPGQKTDKFVQRMISNIATGRPITLNGKDGFRTNPVFVDDAARLFADALTQEESFTVNCAGSEVVSLRNLCDVIGNRLNIKPNYVQIDSSGADCVGDTTLQFEKFGIPTTSLDFGLNLAIAATGDVYV